MAGRIERPMTIESAIHQIDRRQYLLPSIQRNFTWDMGRICRLFDSVMRHYPINNLMLWQVESSEVREGFRFYEFLKTYVERFAENNPSFNTTNHGQFFAVMDGQQRLTSLYLGLKGSYAVKKHRAWWPRANDPSVLPPRKLYLNLAVPLDPDTNDGQMLHDFQFLTTATVAQRPNDETNLWFEVGKVLEFPVVETDDEIIDHVLNFLQPIGFAENRHARKTLQRLYHAVRREPNLTYYVEESQQIDRVLDIFIRTNQGGVPLSFSDLLMSITSANWDDARERVDELVNLIRNEFQFSIDRNFVMKASVMVTESDVRFQVRNFDASSVARIRDDWDDIRDCVVAAFRLVRHFGLNDASLRAKNAVLPIVYYLFHKDRVPEAGVRGRFETINKPISHRADRPLIRQWLLMSLLRGVFGRAGDQLLMSLRAIIRSGLEENDGFPLEQILSEYRGTARDLTFDPEFIERLLRTQKDDPACYAILALVQPDVDITSPLHIDHLHPAAAFTSEALDATVGSDDRRAVFEDRENWNAVVNLHLLTESENTSKQDKPLKAWLEPLQGRTTLDPMIPAGTDLAFDSFEAFIDARAQVIRERLVRVVGRPPMPETVSPGPDAEEPEGELSGP